MISISRSLPIFLLVVVVLAEGRVISFGCLRALYTALPNDGLERDRVKLEIGHQLNGADDDGCAITDDDNDVVVVLVVVVVEILLSLPNKNLFIFSAQNKAVSSLSAYTVTLSAMLSRRTA
mgnify:CR=1 FL=1